LGQVHELRAEDPERSHWGLRPVALVLGVVGAFFGALAVSALFAHPAGAALPGASGSPTVGALSNAARPAVAVLSPVVDADGAVPGSDAAAGPFVTLLVAPTPASHGLAPVIEPISQAIAPPLGAVVTTVAPVPTRALLPTFPFTLPLGQVVATLRVEPVTAAATVRTGGTTTRPPGSTPASGLRPRAGPGSPRPFPPPAWPFQGVPLITSSSPTESSSSSSAGGALAAAPASGPLLPDPPVSGVIPEKGAIPRFLFDLTSSPPG
jgi:hypothetical protein